MAILLTNGGLFLHIPKTAGNWIAEVLELNTLVFCYLGGKHASYKQLTTLQDLLLTPTRYQKFNKELFKFSFVRHPLRWYESWFKMNSVMDWPKWDDDKDVWNPSVKLNGLGAPTFERFLENVIKKQPQFVSNMYEQYTSDIDFVGKQETMVGDLKQILWLLYGEQSKTFVTDRAPVNVSKKIDLLWPESLQKEVEEMEYQAFMQFGYETQYYTQAETSALTAQSLNYYEERIVLKGPYRKQDGFVWQKDLQEFANDSDTNKSPARSRLVLWEDKTRLELSHSEHDKIRAIGNGRYSFWNGTLFFSTTDNSNPNENGRVYSFGFEFVKQQSLLLNGHKTGLDYYSEQ